ncbi:MAG: amidohydrolase family protein, partial [Candidatus Binataceae bacterium]
SNTLERVAPLLARGAVPQVAVRPLVVEFNLRNPFIFASMNAMKPVFGDQSIEAQKEVYAGADFRRHFNEELARRTVFNNLWERVEVKEAETAALRRLQWRSVADIARERGRDPLDVFFDLAIEDNLMLVYMIPLLDIDQERVARKFSDSRTMIGISDGGAHVDMLCNAGYPTYLLGTFVRDKQALSLEHAVKRITSEPAALFGIADRGRLKPGMAADIAIFDLDSVGSAERPEVRSDLPGGGRRLITEAEGVKFTIVNGKILYEDKRHSGVLPGRVLRSRQPPTA